MSEINIAKAEQAALQQTDLKLLFFGREVCPPSHYWGPGLRDMYVLHYIHSGAGLYETNNQTYTLSAGQGFLIVPDTLVHYKASQQDPWTYSWVGFKGISSSIYMKRAGLSAKQPIFQSTGARSWFETFYDQLLQASGHRSSDLQHSSVLLKLMSELIECSSSTGQENAARPSYTKEAYTRKAIDFIENSYSQKISILDIARFVGLDRTYLSGLFQEQFGISLQSYLVQFRMNRAALLLQNKELSVSDVSRSVGYTDPFLFSKMFKKTTGLSPSAARDQHN